MNESFDSALQMRALMWKMFKQKCDKKIIRSVIAVRFKSRKNKEYNTNIVCFNAGTNRSKKSASTIEYKHYH